LLTDDGWVQHRLTDPRYDHPKTYWAQVEGVPTAEALDHLRTGVQSGPISAVNLRLHGSSLKSLPYRRAIHRFAPALTFLPHGSKLF